MMVEKLEMVERLITVQGVRNGQVRLKKIWLV